MFKQPGYLRAEALMIDTSHRRTFLFGHQILEYDCRIMTMIYDSPPIILAILLEEDDDY
jgi:hypothetical protein